MEKERRIIVNMKNYIFADAVSQSLQESESSRFSVQRVTSPEEIKQYSNLCDPYLSLD